MHHTDLHEKFFADSHSYSYKRPLFEIFSWKKVSRSTKKPRKMRNFSASKLSWYTVDPPETTAPVTTDSANFEIDNLRKCKINCHYPCMYSYRYQVMIMEIFQMTLILYWRLLCILVKMNNMKMKNIRLTYLK